MTISNNWCGQQQEVLPRSDVYLSRASPALTCRVTGNDDVSGRKSTTPGSFLRSSRSP